MLFNSYNFLIIFFPLLLITHYFLVIKSFKKLILLNIIFYSLFFYGYYYIPYLLVIIFSITINFLFCNLLIIKNKFNKFYFLTPLLINIFILFYFKYLGAIAAYFNILDNYYFLLPLGISFFTFQQITLIVDIYNQDIKKINFIDYFLYISFFPQLISGPIVKYEFFKKQINNFYKFITTRRLHLSFLLLTIGLFKKLLLADYLSTYNNNLFEALNINNQISFFESWFLLISFSFQIYFDFSGYVDMALGLALFFNIKLPKNFYSPYKSKTIIIFWKNWHITLSNFIRDYIFNPLLFKIQRNNYDHKIKFYLWYIVIVYFSFLLFGLWHGPDIKYIFFGLYHASLITLYSIINNIDFQLPKSISILINFIFVSLGFIIFGCLDISDFLSYSKSLFGFNGISLPSSLFIYFQNDLFEYNGLFNILELTYFQFINITLIIILSTFIIFFCPNSYQIIYEPNFIKYYYLKKIFFKIFIYLIFIFLILNLDKQYSFIYFNF